MKTFADVGIHINEIKGGNQKTTCPKCSHTRQKNTEPCLSVNHDEGVYYCHHCDWKGSLSNGSDSGHDDHIIYNYCDESGTVLYQKVRAYPKKFWLQKPDGGKLSGVRRVLYRLPELINSTGQVFIVGGEKDVETLRKHDLISTTNDNGEGHWRSEFNQFLKDRDVVILEDNDEKGRKHGKAVSQQLKGVAKSIRIIKFPELDKGGDVTDFLASHSVDDLLRKLKNVAGGGMGRNKNLSIDPSPNLINFLSMHLATSWAVLSKQCQKLYKPPKPSVQIAYWHQQHWQFRVTLMW